jgi:hypothetical protein
MLGWAIFVLALAGGPLITAFQSATGIRVPQFTLPGLIALLMLANAARAFVRVRGGDQRDVAPLPPVAGNSPFPRYEPTLPPSATGVPTPEQAGMPTDVRPETFAPRLEPIVNWPLMLVGGVGVLALVALGLFVFGRP